MKLKRTNKLLALLLAVLMVVSLLPVTALAADNDSLKISIDLSQYIFELNDDIKATHILRMSGADYEEDWQTIQSRTVNTYEYKFQSEEVEYTEIRIEIDENHPVLGWKVNGVEYPTDASGYLDWPDNYIVEEKVGILSHTNGMMLVFGLDDDFYNTPGEWTIEPMMPNEFSIAVDLTEYPFDLLGEPTAYDGSHVFQMWDVEPGERFDPIVPGTINLYSYPVDNGIDCQYLEVRMRLDQSHPVTGWIVNGVEYPADGSGMLDWPETTINDGVGIISHSDGMLLILGMEDDYYNTPGTWIVAPILPESSFNLEVTSSDDTKGMVASELISSDTYVLTAIPNVGYSFNYWLKDAAEDTAENRITENPYTVTLDADATFTAYFRERYALTAKSEDTEKGSAAAEYLGVADGKDRYRLTATPADYYLFDKWTCGDDEYTDNPLDVAVAESGKSYTAHFKPFELPLSDGAQIKPESSVINNFALVSSSEYVNSVSVGSRSALLIPATIPQTLENAIISFTLTDENNNEVASWSLERTINKGSGYWVTTLDPTPEFSALTASLTLTTPAGSSTATKTYTGLSVAESETNDDFRFVTSPAEAYTYKTIIQAGANLRGVYGRTDAVTKALSLYAYGPAGVYAWAQGKETDFVLLGSLPTGNSKEVLALGPNGEKGLTAVVGDTTLQLYTWDGTSWTSVSGSALSADQYGLGTKVTLVMDADDVWTDTRHWNGTAWESQSYAFAAFERVSDTEAYGVDENGKRWRYDGTDWTAAEAVSAPEIASVTSFSPNGYNVALGQDQHGDWYLFVQSRFHFIDNSGFYGYSGSDVYKWNGEKWVYQIMTDFNDPEDDLTETKQRIRPDGVQTISSPAPGVSVMYGSRRANGAIYLSADNVTITFDPGEGTLDDAALAKLTAPILSEIDSKKVPGATRNNYVFGGWYYDEACTVEFDAGSTAMPGGRSATDFPTSWPFTASGR